MPPNEIFTRGRWSFDQNEASIISCTRAFFRRLSPHQRISLSSRRNKTKGIPTSRVSSFLLFSLFLPLLKLKRHVASSRQKIVIAYVHTQQVNDTAASVSGSEESAKSRRIKVAIGRGEKHAHDRALLLATILTFQ